MNKFVFLLSLRRDHIPTCSPCLGQNVTEPGVYSGRYLLCTHQPLDTSHAPLIYWSQVSCLLWWDGQVTLLLGETNMNGDKRHTSTCQTRLLLFCSPDSSFSWSNYDKTDWCLIASFPKLFFCLSVSTSTPSSRSDKLILKENTLKPYQKSIWNSISPNSTVKSFSQICNFCLQYKYTQQ